MSYKIYLVEDEENLNELLSSYLSKEGWHVQPFLCGEKAMQAIAERPDLWILDIMLPDIDGYRLLQYIKADDPSIPVIYISARDAELDRVLGLEMGSDDYLPKPFLPRELVIRTRKLLERVYGDQYNNMSLIKIHPYLIDERRRKLTQNEQEIDLTSKEFDLMVLLARNQGLAFSREQVLDHVWGQDYIGSDRVVDDLVRRLRKKLPELGVETIYGYGYRLVKS
ncbi:transcriptional regulatory protein cssr [hydrocarbon metagenome]|uniref:Transcriptional regulatory protein cssr n=1 Tax=hydrocarbon metagenome TaxID=938273 RepID=A0A0W8E3Y8_9ZZZZ